MNGYVRRSEKKRQAILDAAQALFFARGITDVTVSEIAASAKVSQVTIYNYFQSKENLISDVLFTYMTKALDEAEALLDLQIPFTEKVQRVLIESERSADVFSQRFFDTVSWGDAALQERYSEIAQTKALPFFQRLIEQGKQEGAIDKSIPIEAVMAYMSALIPILTQPDFLKTTKEYKDGIQRLFFFGLVGTEQSGHVE